ncbi:MAG: hypothetical protein KC516_04800 [Nanoarchaeota archaeon]|nr:hypothetical protein [Nanoarchaeota archaeon]
MKNKFTLGAITLAVIAVMGVGLVAALPFGKGLLNQDLSEEEIADMQSMRDQMRDAIETGDFDSWKALIESQLTEENFNNIVERHYEMSEVSDLRDQIRTAIQDGDYETAEELRAELEQYALARPNYSEDKGRFMYEEQHGRGMGYGQMMGFN